MAACAKDAVPSHDPGVALRKLTAVACIAAVLVVVARPECATVCGAPNGPDEVDQKLVELRKSVSAAMSPTDSGNSLARLQR
jgi:hypothetical protein